MLGPGFLYRRHRPCGQTIKPPRSSLSLGGKDEGGGKQRLSPDRPSSKVAPK